MHPNNACEWLSEREVEQMSRWIIVLAYIREWDKCWTMSGSEGEEEDMDEDERGCRCVLNDGMS